MTVPSSPPSTPTILITGASGNYGRLAITHLLALNIPPSSLHLLTRQPPKLSTYASLGLHIRRGSFDDPLPLLTTAFSGTHTLLLISTSRAGARLPQHRNAINAAVRAGVQHIVYTSFIGASLENPTALVVREHAATEKMLRESGLAWTALRDSQYAEAMRDVVAPAALATDGIVRCNAGTGKIAFVSRDDCVRCAVAVLINPSAHVNKTYDITGPELLTWGDATKLIEEILGGGKEVRYEDLSDEEQLAWFDKLGVPREPIDDFVSESGHPWNSSDMVSFGKATRVGEMEVWSGDVEMLTGRRPRSLREVFEEGLIKEGGAKNGSAKNGE